MVTPASPDFLHDEGLRLLFFGGKGGVGKTTCACASALQLAHSHPESAYLLVSTDPAHSLLDCLSGSLPPANLTLKEIDPQACLLRFKALHEEHLRTIALRGTFLDESDIRQLVDLSMPGMDEMMALLEIVAWVKEDRYACIVVDTAPAGHTLRMLELPALMGQWIAALDTMLAKHRYMAGIYRGSYRKDAVDDYLAEAVADLAGLQALLSNPARCRFVPVMLAEELSIHITRTLLAELDQLGLGVREIVLNRLLTEVADCPDCLVQAEQQRLGLAHAMRVFAPHVLWGLPLVYAEPIGAAHLMPLWGKARPLTDTTWQVGGALPAPRDMPQRRVNHPPALPPVSTTLLMFAGKGGVGKTTLACATALRLAEQRPGKEVLLFSIDPAHSLGACLDFPIGPQEVRVAPGLSAIELNAQAEYAVLKQEYASELKGVFQRESAQSGVGLAFDREVMERMLDVAPLGLDEVLAITRIVDLMDRKRYDTFVLDTAPTGHLLRFLEMPELIDQWLKTFFALFLKYRQVFWFERITQTMVTLSRRIKLLRRMLVDPQQAALVLVTIPTGMAYAETTDLLAACARMGIAVPLQFVNLVNGPSHCPVCALMRRTQASALEKYAAAAAAAGCQVAQVQRQDEPRGIHRLRVLGQELYA